MTTRKEVFFNFLKDRPGEKFSVIDISAALTVPKTHFVTDIRKWMDTPEFAHIHRAAVKGGKGRDSYVYWYDKRKVHAPLPPAAKLGPRVPKVTSNALVPMKRKAVDRLTESFAQVLGFDSQGNIILLDDKDQVIRGKVMQ